MPTSQVTTADYPKDARQRLGLAVTRAREANGWARRADFADHAGISLRSLVKLEQGGPGVGRKVLDAVGRAIPNWNEDTPYAILRGEPIPSADKPTLPIPELSESDLSEGERTQFLMARDFMRTQGRELTLRRWERMRVEFERLEELDRQSTEADHAQ